MNQHEQIVLEIRVAELYFLEGHDQRTIGEMLGFSRSKVSRLLKKALHDGVVEVRIKNPMEKVSRLEDSLKQKYGLEHAIVVRGAYTSEALLRKALGMVTAELADSIIEKGDVIGICSGRTIHEMILSLGNSGRKGSIEVVPLLGGMGRVEKEYQINELCRKFAEHFGGVSKLIDAPLVVRTKETYDLLLEEKGIKAVREDWSRLTKVFVTIGAPPAVSPLTLNYAALEQEERKALETNAVGDICGRFFNREGEECRTKVGERIIGITFDELSKTPLRVGIGGGQDRIAGIKGVLAKGIINALVTDEQTAKNVLQ